ncbi:MAG TPA: hypothetical protein O0X18_01910 [Methanocorpusculum sp.]|nr:hypothetical protein [Methanocorpusculum sp.]
MNVSKVTMIVLAVFLAVLIFAGSSAAASAYDREINLTTAGNYVPVFVYEKVVINQTGGTNATVLNKLGDGANPSVINTIHADADGVFTLLNASIAGETGAYRIGNTNRYVMIYYPDLILKAYYLGSNGRQANEFGKNNINGKNIYRDSGIVWYIESPHVGSAVAGGGFPDPVNVTITITTPSGGKTTMFGDTALDEIQITGVLPTTQGYPKSFRWGRIGDNAEFGKYTAQAEFQSPACFHNYAEKSNTIGFTVTNNPTLTLTTKFDKVVKTNSFTVTIKSDPGAKTFLYIEQRDLKDGCTYPEILPGQGSWITIGTQNSFVIPTFEDGTKPLVGSPGSYARVSIAGNSWGTRTVEYTTNASTADTTYTVKVYNLEKTGSAFDRLTSVKDSVKVTVEKGEVTISAAGGNSYYLGEEIRLSGNNTAGTYTYLFLTGPNLADENGIIVKKLGTQTPAYKAGLSEAVAVTTNHTWEYTWDTAGCGLDTGVYTLYATGALTNGKSSSYQKITGDTNEKQGAFIDGDYVARKLSDTEYGTLSLSLKRPALSAVPSASVVAKGDKLIIRGTADGNPSAGLKIYVFGPNRFLNESVSVKDDGTYEKKLDIPQDWASNQYFVVLQHPMYNNRFDAAFDGVDTFSIPNSGAAGTQSSFRVLGADKLQGSQAADALCKLIDSPNIDDIYTKLTFTVAEPWIRISNPGTQTAGSVFTLSGTTNLAAGDRVLVEVVSTAFTATDKTSTSSASGFSRSVTVTSGSADNVWSAEVDTANLAVDQYTIRVSGIEVDAGTSTEFGIAGKTVQTATPAQTAPAAATATAVPSATPTARQSPGFGLIAALGLAGAAVLLRKH